MSFRKLSEGQRFVVESCLTAEPVVVDAGPGIRHREFPYLNLIYREI